MYANKNKVDRRVDAKTAFLLNGKDTPTALEGSKSMGYIFFTPNAIIFYSLNP